MCSCVYSWENDDTLPRITMHPKSIENRERRVFMNRLITAIVFAGLLVPTIRAADKPAEAPCVTATVVGRRITGALWPALT